MPDARRKLSATAYAVLGLLSFGRELSGYDLKKWADHSLGLFFWSPATSQIYSELRRLEELGYVESREVAQDALRNKRLYRITPPGDEELRRWLHDTPVDVPVLKHPVLLRVWLGHLMEPEQLRTVIAEHIERTESQLAQVGRDLEIQQQGASWELAELILRWAERHYRSERDNAAELLDELEAFVRAPAAGRSKGGKKSRPS